MTSKEYQERAHEFAQYGDNSYPYFGLAEEAGEVCGKMAKFIRHNDGIPPWVAIESFPNAKANEIAQFKADVFKELGDVMWMVAEIATINGLDLEEIMCGNIAKLEDRKARGKIDGEGDDR